MNPSTGPVSIEGFYDEALSVPGLLAEIAKGEDFGVDGHVIAWIDLTGRTQRPPQESPILFIPEMARLFAQAYLAGQPADDPYLDPLHTDLTGLPPLLIHAASGDSVLQEAQLLAQHAKACAVATTTTIYPVLTHDFHIFWSFLPEATTALEELGQFIRDAGAPRLA